MTDPPIDPKRFPTEHPGDYAVEGKGRCRTKDAAGKACGARWGWHYWPWDSRGDCC